jgi:hypothetical protein
VVATSHFLDFAFCQYVPTRKCIKCRNGKYKYDLCSEFVSMWMSPVVLNDSAVCREESNEATVLNDSAVCREESNEAVVLNDSAVCREESNEAAVLNDSAVCCEESNEAVVLNDSAVCCEESNEAAVCQGTFKSTYRLCVSAICRVLTR